MWLELEGDIASGGPLRVGGYASEECPELDPVGRAAHFAAQAEKAQQAGERGGAQAQSGATESWALLAQWRPGIRGREGATVHWAIRREDLAAHRFDRAHVTVFWNP